MDCMIPGSASPTLAINTVTNKVLQPAIQPPAPTHTWLHGCTLTPPTSPTTYSTIPRREEHSSWRGNANGTDACALCLFVVVRTLADVRNPQLLTLLSAITTECFTPTSSPTTSFMLSTMIQELKCVHAVAETHAHMPTASLQCNPHQNTQFSALQHLFSSTTTGSRLLLSSAWKYDAHTDTWCSAILHNPMHTCKRIPPAAFTPVPEVVEQCCFSHSVTYPATSSVCSLVFLCKSLETLVHHRAKLQGLLAVSRVCAAHSEI